MFNIDKIGKFQDFQIYYDKINPTFKCPKNVCGLRYVYNHMFEMLTLINILVMVCPIIINEYKINMKEKEIK